MKKLMIGITGVILCLSMILLASCGADLSANTGNSNSSNTGNKATVNAGAIDGSAVNASETATEFTMTTSDGSFTGSDGVYTITSGGTYSLQGGLNGQIIVEAGEAEVTLELNGVTIICSDDSPVKILSAGSVEISAKSGTENVIKDTRSVKTTDDETQGEGAIYAKCDLKLKGSGTLVVSSTYNNGIHTTKDLTIQKLSLKSTAYNNAIKGNDSVTVKSGTVIAISTNGDGIKTENTDADKNGNTRGDVVISGGSVAVYAAGDGIQSAHDFELTTGEDGIAPSVSVFTGSYSEYTDESASATSQKGVKVQNDLNIVSGLITVQSYDDGLHADYGTSFTDGGTGQGTINVSGGEISITVNTEGSSSGGSSGFGGGRGGGHGGPGGQSGQGSSGADGIHADYKLNISGGTVNIDGSYEGLEGNVITVSGGMTRVTASDDGVNACKGPASTPAVSVSGGYLDVTVSPSGDTDGIDSNGTYTQTGGVVITRGPNMEMAAALDSERTVSITGGTLIILGYGKVSAGSGVKTYSLSLHSAGSHTVKIDGVSYTFTNASAFGRTTVYSSVTVSA